MPSYSCTPDLQCHIPDRTDDILFGSDFDGESDRYAKEFNLMSFMYQTYMEYGLDSPEYQNLAAKRVEKLSEWVELV